MLRLTAIIHGHVSGGGFRTRIAIIANAFDLKGFVQNLDDGTVRVLAEGEEVDLERFAKAINVKNRSINVTSIEKQYSSGIGDLEGFGIFLDEVDSELYEVAEALIESETDSETES
jgi:acylphosphatase